MAGEIDGGQLGIGNFDAFGIFVFVQFGADFEAGVGCGRGDQRQLMVMNEKRRCSILFHLLVPGGKWHTVMGSLSSSASF